MKYTNEELWHLIRRNNVFFVVKTVSSEQISDAGMAVMLEKCRAGILSPQEFMKALEESLPKTFVRF